MDNARCQDIAHRLNLLLQEQVGLGLDARRLLHEPLYARDVLLVCDAHPGSELAALARDFRSAAAAAARAPSHAAPPSTPLADRAAVDGEVDGEVDSKVRGQPAAENPADPGPPPGAPRARSAMSRFSRLTLSRFGASIFGGSLFEGTLFGSAKADPVTDFGDDSYLSATPRRGPGQPRSEPGPAQPTAKARPRRTRWFGR